MILGHAPLTSDHPDFGAFERHPGRWVMDQAFALSQYSDFNIILVTVVKGATKDFKLQMGKLSIIYLRAQPRFRVWTLFLWDRYRLRNLIKYEKPDLVHAHGIEDSYALAICKLKIPKELTLQALYEDYNNKNVVKWYSAPRLIECLEKRALKGFETAIVKSQQFKEVVQKYHPSLRCIIIPNTLNRIFLDILDVPFQKNKLAFVGTICERKGFHVIRKALEKIDPNHHALELHVYGDGGDIDYIRSECTAIEATGHKLFNHGSVSAEQLADELSTTNILIAPSYGETFGNQVIEAMLCRCHCIVSEETGMAENIRKYGHGTIVPQRGSNEIAEAIIIQLIHETPDQEMDCREAARSMLIDDLGLERIASRLVSVYEKVMLGKEKT